VAEDEDGQGAAADWVDGDHPAGGVVDDDVPLVPGRGVQREGGDIKPPVVDELGLGPEGQAAGGRVEPIGPDYQVEPARRRLLEGDVHTAAVLAQRGDGVIEPVLGRGPTCLKQDRGEVGARQLHLLAACRALQGPHVDPADPAAGAIDEARRGRVGAGLAQPFHHAHPLGDRHGRAADVHRAAAGAQPRRAFHDGGAEPVPRQPVRHGGPGDTGAGDQDGRGGLGVHHTLLSLGLALRF